MNYFLNIYFPLSVIPPVSSTDKTDSHDITEILLKVVLNKTNKHLFIKLSSDLYFGNMYLGTSLRLKVGTVQKSKILKKK
jgi:hypothetical protein